MSARILPIRPNPVPGPRYINRDDINDSYEACPYCTRIKGGRFACCGENHFERVIELVDGEIISRDDVVIIEDMWKAMQEDQDR